MDSNSVKNAFSISPSVAGKFTISNNLKTFVYKTDNPLLYNQNYFMKIDSSARSTSGVLLDANKDGVAGDSYIVNFRTQPSTNFKNEIQIPKSSVLHQNFPNPFNSQTQIRF